MAQILTIDMSREFLHFLVLKANSGPKKLNMAPNMEALVFDKSELRIQLTSVEKPKIVNDDDVLVQVLNCGVCGTNVHIFHGAIPNVGQRFIPGHEAGGVVVGIGSKVTEVVVGDRVAIDPNRGCHNCAHCRRSNPHFCPKGSFNDAIGIHRNGGFAPYLVAPAEQVYKVPDDFDMAYLSLVEPLSCIVHGWRLLSKETSPNDMSSRDTLL